MATLIVYASLPEEVKFYLIPDGDLIQEDHNKLRVANNKFINSDETTDEMEWLSEKLGGPWARFEHKMSDGNIVAPYNNAISRVYYAGFIL